MTSPSKSIAPDVELALNLVVSGLVTVTNFKTRVSLNLSARMGVVAEKGEGYSLKAFAKLPCLKALIS